MFANILITSALVAGSMSTLAAGAASISYKGSYDLIADFSGSSFFAGFNAFVGADPTHGHVNYTDKAFAVQQGLLSYKHYEDMNLTTAYIGVDHTNPAPTGRNSVRLVTPQRFNPPMLATYDVHHAPVGPSLWPALWMLGNVGDGIWPSNGGEIDILEWVHDTPFNSMTAHTEPGCTVDNSTTLFHGNLVNSSCNAGNGADGCSIHAPAMMNNQLATAGPDFNKQGGAVVAQEWTNQGVSIWAFGRDKQPQDLHSGNPDTAKWGTPLARFAGDQCDFPHALREMQLIINIDFCGDWAGKVWETSGMAQKTGVSTCDDFVANNPTKFVDAYWEIAEIKIYSGATQGGTGSMNKRDSSEMQVSQVQHHANASSADCYNSTAHPEESNISNGTVYRHRHGAHAAGGNRTHSHGHGYNCSSNDTSDSYVRRATANTTIANKLGGTILTPSGETFVATVLIPMQSSQATSLHSWASNYNTSLSAAVYGTLAVAGVVVAALV